MEKDVLKPFSITHQKVTLDFEFSSRTIFASTEIQIYLNSVEIPLIRLHSKKCEINSVTVNDKIVRFEVFDPCVQLCQTEEVSKGKCDTTLLQKVFDFARTEADQGELSIEIPSDIKLEEHLAPEIASKKEDSNNLIETEEKKQTSPLIIKIDYSINDPDTGIMFSSNYRVSNNQGSSYLYTLNQQGPGDARCWVPSRDDAHEKCTWELDFIVSQGTENEEETGFSVIASGLLVSQERLPLDTSRSLVHYFIPFPCPAYLVSFVVGKFDSLLITEMDNYQNDQAIQENEDTELSKKVMAYAPLGWKEELRNSCQTVEKIMEYYINEFGSYPNDSVKLVFLPTSNMPLIVGAEVSMLSLEFLHSEDIIDQTFETRRLIALAIASQWFGVSVVPKTSPDIWMVLGLSGFMASLFLKSHFGQNEYRYRMKHDMLNIAHLDVNRPPLFNSRLTNPFDPDDLNFIRLKSTFVLYMLDKQMLKGAASAGLHRMIQKVLISAMCGELSSGNTLSTHWFLRTCRKLSGVDLKGFAEQWIYCSGCPTFQFSYSFNRKKMVVEIDVKQSNTNAGVTDDPNLSLEAIKPAKFFSGHMTASIREPDGTPYEHVLDIQEDVTRFEVQFNTKYKRIRRSTKRFQKRKAEAAAAEAIVKDQLDGDNADNDDLFLTEEGKEKEKEDWRIVEWGEADEESLESATFEWIRLDSDFEWICLIDLDQPDYMWAGQLEKDRDVVSQFEAVQALKKFPSQATSTTLLRTVMNTQCFYRIRADAANALVYCSLEQLNYIGRHHLLRIFHKKYCVDEQEDEQHPENFLLRPNDFSNLSEYFVQKAVILAISNLDKDLFEPVSHKLLSNLLVNNDNSNNTYSDCYYISTMITALGNALDTPSSIRQGKTVQLLVDELKRYSTMDYLIPSYQNVITVSCLQTYTKLFIRGTIKPDLILLLTHSRYGNFTHVRMVAFDGLLLLGALLIPAIRTYLFNTMESDPDYYLRYYISSNITKICAIYQGKAVEKELRLSVNQDSYSMNSLDGLSNNHHGYTSSKWNQFRESSECQQTIRRMLANSSLDHRVRNNIYILCRILYTDSMHDPCNFGAFQIRIHEQSALLNKPVVTTEVSVDNIIKQSSKDTNIAKYDYDHTNDTIDYKNSEPTLILKMKIHREDSKAHELNSQIEASSKKSFEKSNKSSKELIQSNIPHIKLASPRVKSKELEKALTAKPHSSKESSRKITSDGRGLSESDAASAKKLLIKLADHEFGPHLAGKRSRDMLATDAVEEHPITILKLRGKLHNGKFSTLSSLQIEIDKMFDACFQIHGTDESLVCSLKDLHSFYRKEARQLLGWVTGPLNTESIETKKHHAINDIQKPVAKKEPLSTIGKDSSDILSKSPVKTQSVSSPINISNKTESLVLSPKEDINESHADLHPISPALIDTIDFFEESKIFQSDKPCEPSISINDLDKPSVDKISFSPKEFDQPKQREKIRANISPLKKSPIMKLQKSPIHRSHITESSSVKRLSTSTSPSHISFHSPYDLSREKLRSPNKYRRPSISPVQKDRDVSAKVHRSHVLNSKPKSANFSTSASPSRSVQIPPSPSRTSIKLTVRPPRPVENQIPDEDPYGSSDIHRIKPKSLLPHRSPVHESTSVVLKVNQPSKEPKSIDLQDYESELSRKPTPKKGFSSREERPYHDKEMRDYNANSTKITIRPPRTPSPIQGSRKDFKREERPHYNRESRDPNVNTTKITIRPPRTPSPIQASRKDSKRDERPHFNRETRDPNTKTTKITIRPPRTPSPTQGSRKDFRREERPHYNRDSRDSNANTTKITIRPPRTPSPIQGSRKDLKREERPHYSRETKDSNTKTTKITIRPPRTPSPIQENRKDSKRERQRDFTKGEHPRPNITPEQNLSSVPQGMLQLTGAFFHSEDYFTSKDLLKSLMQSEEAQPFVFPIDLIPGGDLIEEPLGLRVVRHRLKKNIYLSVDEMKNDLENIMSQCLRAMDKYSELYSLARSKKKSFFQEWAETFPTKKRYLSEDESKLHSPSSKRRDVSKVPYRPGITDLPSSIKKSPLSRYSDLDNDVKRNRGSMSSSKLTGKSENASPNVERNQKIRSDNVSNDYLKRSSKYKDKPVHHSSSYKDDNDLIKIPREVSPKPKMKQRTLASPILKTKDSIVTSSIKKKDILLSPSRKHIPPKSMDKSKAIYDYCSSILKKLENHHSSPCFREPVDPVFLGIPTYLDIITHPMDLRTVRSKLEARKYKDFKDFDHDVRLIARNACLFNQPGTWVYSEAQRLEDFYKSQVADFDGTFLSKDDINRLIGIFERFNREEFSDTFMPTTKYEQYLETPYDFVSLVTLLSANKFIHIGEFEAAILNLLHVCYSLFSPTDIEYEHALRFEKKYVKYFERAFDRKSAIGQVRLLPPIVLMTDDVKNQCVQLFKKLATLKASQFFLEPVDYKKWNLPHYPKIIRQPMDLGTAEKKLTSGAYHTIDEFEKDILRICYNCYNFNGIDSFVSIDAQKIEKFFLKEWEILKKNISITNHNILQSPSRSSTKSLASKRNSKPVSRSPAQKPIVLSSFTLQLMKEALTEIQKKPNYIYFKDPVDPVALGIPTYFDFIKKPMDFGTIQNKLKKGIYLNLEEFLADAQLVFANCYTFNHPSDIVFKAGKSMESAWKSICKEKGLLEDPKSPAEISIISPQVSNRSSHQRSREAPKEERRGSDSRRRSDDHKVKSKSRR